MEELSGVTSPVNSAREAINMIADLLDSDFSIDRLAEHAGFTVGYDDIVCVRYAYWAG